MAILIQLSFLTKIQLYLLGACVQQYLGQTLKDRVTHDAGRETLFDSKNDLNFIKLKIQDERKLFSVWYKFYDILILHVCPFNPHSKTFKSTIENYRTSTTCITYLWPLSSDFGLKNAKSHKWLFSKMLFEC